MVKEFLYVTAYYPFRTSEADRGVFNYLSYLFDLAESVSPRTLHLFLDEQLIDQVKEFNIPNINIINYKFNNLPTYPICSRIFDTYQTSKVDFNNISITNLEWTSLMFGKFYLMRELKDIFKLKTNKIIWVDCGLLRHVQYPNFDLYEEKIMKHDFQIAIQLNLTPYSLYFSRDLESRIKSGLANACGSIFSIDSSYLDEVCKVTKDYLEFCCEKGLCPLDDQIILSQLYSNFSNNCLVFARFFPYSHVACLSSREGRYTRSVSNILEFFVNGIWLFNPSLYLLILFSIVSKTLVPFYLLIYKLTRKGLISTLRAKVK